METEKKKRGRPPKIYTAETSGMTYEGVINYKLDKQVRKELDDTLAHKSKDELTEGERKYLESRKENKSRTLNVRFTESEYQDIISKCRQYGYKKKSEYVRDCVRARVPLDMGFSPNITLSLRNKLRQKNTPNKCESTSMNSAESVNRNAVGRGYSRNKRKHILNDAIPLRRTENAP